MGNKALGQILAEVQRNDIPNTIRIQACVHLTTRKEKYFITDISVIIGKMILRYSLYSQFCT